MAEPPVITFGRTYDADTWWAVLPSDAVLRHASLSELLALVEQAMAVEHPGRPFSFSLDTSGMWDPGDEELTAQGSI